MWSTLWQNWVKAHHHLLDRTGSLSHTALWWKAAAEKTELCKRLFAHCTVTAQRCCSIRGDELWGTETGQAFSTEHTVGTLQHSNPCTVSSGLAPDQENGVQWVLAAPHIEQTQAYFSHFICIYIHYILILQVVKAIILI